MLCRLATLAAAGVVLAASPAAASFHANKIAFPYPQRDLHIMTPVDVRVQQVEAGGGASKP